MVQCESRGPFHRVSYICLKVKISDFIHVDHIHQQLELPQPLLLNAKRIHSIPI